MGRRRNKRNGEDFTIQCYEVKCVCVRACVCVHAWWGMGLCACVCLQTYISRKVARIHEFPCSSTMSFYCV